MKCVGEITSAYLPPLDEANIQDDRPVRFQVVYDRTFSSYYIQDVIAMLIDKQHAIVYDCTKLKVKNTKSLSSAYAQRWFHRQMKKVGTSTPLSVLVLNCPSGYHIPLKFLVNLSKGYYLHGNSVMSVRVNNIILIHNGTTLCNGKCATLSKDLDIYAHYEWISPQVFQSVRLIPYVDIIKHLI